MLHAVMTVNTHYTFGDVDLAAERLRHLARVFEPSLVAFLDRVGIRQADRVVDLGCGPGETTRTLARLLTPTTIVGIDGSDRFIAQARHEGPASIECRLGDVTRADFSGLEADVVFSRFLLTHLPEPAAALSHWAGALKPWGRMLLQETAELASDHPALGRYYELVGELQRRHGQSLHIGRELEGLVDTDRYRIASFAQTPLDVSASDMARLHAMNIQTWRHDSAARAFDPAEIDRLSEALQELAADATTTAHVTYTMGEMVLALH
jgi:SAM-dependent methyltransferase